MNRGTLLMSVIVVTLLLLPLVTCNGCCHRGPPGKKGVPGDPGPDGPPGPSGNPDLTFDVQTVPGPISLITNYTSVLYYSDANDPAQFTLADGFNGQLKQIGLETKATVPFRVSANAGNLQFTADQLPQTELIFINGTWRTVAPWNAQDQQGPDLVGTPCTACLQGQDVALSADGNTAAWTAFAGGSNDTGVFFVFVRDPDTGTWSQQHRGTSTVAGTNANFVPCGIALSAAGDTLAMSCFIDSFFTAVTVATRSGTTWTVQQTLLITEDNTVGLPGNIAISSSGNTLAVGGNLDLDSNEGHIYVWVRSAGAWTLQTKLQPAAPVVPSAFSTQLGMTSDGNLIAGSGPTNNGTIGAVWLFARSGTTWTELAKAVPADPVLPDNFFGKTCVRLSGSGDSLVVGSDIYDNIGGFWVFQRTGTGQWLQQGLVYTIDQTVQNIFLSTTGLALSKDGQTVATTDFPFTQDELTVRIWRRSFTDFIQIASTTKAILTPLGALGFSGDASTMISNVGSQGGNGAVGIYV